MRTFKLALISAVALGLAAPAFAQTTPASSPKAVEKTVDVKPAEVKTEFKVPAAPAIAETPAKTAAATDAKTETPAKGTKIAHSKSHAKKLPAPAATSATPAPSAPAKM